MFTYFHVLLTTKSLVPRREKCPNTEVFRVCDFLYSVISCDFTGCKSLWGFVKLSLKTNYF